MVNRFQRIAGFDRSMALASSMLTAMIPLAIVYGSVLARFGGSDVAQRIIDRYGLTGSGADAVRHIFSSVTDTSTGVLGALFLTISMLSFARAVQRLFEQTWQLKPLSVRNTANDLRWALAFMLYVPVSGWLLGFVGRGRLGFWTYLVEVPLTGIFLVWGGWILSARRVVLRDLVPFGVIAAAMTTVYSVGAKLYLPRLFNSYAARYGAVGVVFAMLSAFFVVVLIIVGSAALGREVRDETARIRQGQRPPDNEVRREWDNVVGQMRERWQAGRGRISRLRSARKSKRP
ncbi:YhjD/YihY/BrkB family envelope integrity protein [Kitasatospora mediocidica]|uniref:YhjD/YihY/BrkB family envelope integrity protein n=1 Tax=Kitasatospora mediocidica TaxID=58352 RepID=UPI000B026DE8|nr:YhjD/YihY/BrkB family envelope integrity protein [Kitasatospora mediocidica]